MKSEVLEILLKLDVFGFPYVNLGDMDDDKKSS
jgi:hypothetical protein